MLRMDTMLASEWAETRSLAKRTDSTPSLLLVRVCECLPGPEGCCPWRRRRMAPWPRRCDVMHWCGGSLMGAMGGWLGQCIGLLVAAFVFNYKLSEGVATEDGDIHIYNLTFPFGVREDGHDRHDRHEFVCVVLMILSGAGYELQRFPA
jgi:hypothetical protein